MVFLKKAHQRNLSILGIHKTGTKSANHDRHIHSKNIVQMNDTVSKKRSDQIMNSHRGVINSLPVKSTPREVSCEAPIHEGKVRNSLPVKSTPGEVSCEAPITREKSETHFLRRARRGR